MILRSMVTNFEDTKENSNGFNLIRLHFFIFLVLFILCMGFWAYSQTWYLGKGFSGSGPDIKLYQEPLLWGILGLLFLFIESVLIGISAVRYNQKELFTFKWTVIFSIICLALFEVTSLFIGFTTDPILFLILVGVALVYGVIAIFTHFIYSLFYNRNS